MALQPGSHSSSVSCSNCFMRLQTYKKAMGWCTVQWKMLMLRKTHREREEEEEEEEEEEDDDDDDDFGNFLVRYFRNSATGCVVVHHENT